MHKSYQESKVKDKYILLKLEYNSKTCECITFVSNVSREIQQLNNKVGENRQVLFLTNKGRKDFQLSKCANLERTFLVLMRQETPGHLLGQAVYVSE
jgi:hypothetical protein